MADKKTFSESNLDPNSLGYAIWNEDERTTPSSELERAWDVLDRQAKEEAMNAADKTSHKTPTLNNISKLLAQPFVDELLRMILYPIQATPAERRPTPDFSLDLRAMATYAMDNNYSLYHHVRDDTKASLRANPVKQTLTLVKPTEEQQYVISYIEGACTLISRRNLRTQVEEIIAVSYFNIFKRLTGYFYTVETSTNTHNITTNIFPDVATLYSSASKTGDK